MKRKQITAWLLFGGAVVLLALWGYARTGWDHAVRLQVVLHGFPFAEVRKDPVGSRPDGNDHNLAYRRSVYSQGQYLGYVDRFGNFISPGDVPGNPWPMVTVVAIFHWGQWLATALIAVGAMILWRSRKNELSQHAVAGYGSQPRARERQR